MALIVLIPKLMKDERSLKVRSTPPLGFLFIFDLESTMTTATDQALSRSKKGAKCLLFGCKLVPRHAKLMAQLEMVGLCWVQPFAQTSGLGPLMPTVGWNHTSLAAVSWTLLKLATEAHNCLHELVNTYLTFVRRSKALGNVSKVGHHFEKLSKWYATIEEIREEQWVQKWTRDFSLQRLLLLLGSRWHVHVDTISKLNGRLGLSKRSRSGRCSWLYLHWRWRGRLIAQANIDGTK